MIWWVDRGSKGGKVIDDSSVNRTRTATMIGQMAIGGVARRSLLDLVR